MTPWLEGVVILNIAGMAILISYYGMVERVIDATETLASSVEAINQTLSSAYEDAQGRLSIKESE